MIDHLETLVSLWEINTGDGHQGLELALRVVAKECEDGGDSGRCDVERQFVLQHRELLDKFR